MAGIYDTLQSRWTFDGVPGFSGPAKTAFTKALEIGKGLQAKRAEIGQDKNRTPAGHQEKFRKHLAENAHQLVRVLKTAEKLKTKLGQHVAKVQPKAPDKSDVAAAVARSDLRNMLRGMSVAQRMELLLAPDADPTLQAAVLELPNYASGINDFTRNEVTNRAIERENPGALAAIAKIKGAIEMVEIANKVAFGAAMETGGFPNAKALDEFVESSVGDSSRLEADVDQSIDQAA